MCRYCENKEEFIIRDEENYIELHPVIKSDEIVCKTFVFSESCCADTIFSVKINYCPFCGRKLEVD